MVDPEITEDIQLEDDESELPLPQIEPGPLPQNEFRLQPVKCKRGRLYKYFIKANTVNISIYL